MRGYSAGMTLSEVDSTDAGPLVPIIASVIWIPVGFLGLVSALNTLLDIDSGFSSSRDGLANAGIISFPLACFATVPIAWAVWVNTRKRAGTTKWRVLSSLVPLVSVAMVVIGALAWY